MNKQQRLHVAFDEPSAGWLAIEVRAGDQRVHENFSYIYPTLPNLCAALCDVLGGGPSRRVTFLLEPDELELTIAPEGQTEMIWRVRTLRDPYRTLTPAPSLELRGAAASIVLPFWRALRRLQTRSTPTTFIERFREPFPELEMAALTRLVAMHKSRSTNH
jgi:hypothetical protein